MSGERRSEAVLGIPLPKLASLGLCTGCLCVIANAICGFWASFAPLLWSCRGDADPDLSGLWERHAGRTALCF